MKKNLTLESVLDRVRGVKPEWVPDLLEDYSSAPDEKKPFTLLLWAAKTHMAEHNREPKEKRNDETD